ncbi:MAG TPA: hypothetical protein DEQ38_12860 [Elusimicrobia bacterium]|nr:MAG: hypothetical protein A2089_12205 [Elusimicrobia bacterium GWD2_63_28]HCC48987.1 hypothetical protein [Elusimicrobiota bacterium]
MKRTYGIAGNGRASTHLQAYFRLLKIPHKVWSRQSALAPAEVLGDCSRVFLLIKDEAIAPFVAANPFLKGKTLIHFSGSLNVKGVFAMHPFMPLAARPLTLAQYRAIPFALDPGVELKALVPEFSNPSFPVKRSQKKLYHALCVLGANLPVILWQKTMGDLGKKFSVPPDLAQRYFQATLENFRADPARALSGPIARRDAPTIASDIKALGKDPFAGAYSLFARIYENN